MKKIIAKCITHLMIFHIMGRPFDFWNEDCILPATPYDSPVTKRGFYKSGGLPGPMATVAGPLNNECWRAVEVTIRDENASQMQDLNEYYV